MARMLLGIAAAALLGVGCASVPKPEGELANADLAMRRAEAVNAAQIAPLDARLARDNLEKAKLAMQKGKYVEARRLAENAEVDALVAEAKARSTRVQRATEELRQEVGELQRGAGKSAEGAK